jgi:hypothetical protein
VDFRFEATNHICPQYLLYESVQMPVIAESV